MNRTYCDGCEKQIEPVEGVVVAAIKGEMRLLMYGDPSNLRDPRMRTQRRSATSFHWCDRCAGAAVKAVREANGK
jgi:hypothetical protein